jgi:hypothetical protein
MRVFSYIARVDHALRLVWPVAALILAVHSSAAESIQIHVYSNHFEVEGRRFASVEELSDALRGRDLGRTLAVAIAECGTGAKLRELGALLRERGIVSVDYTRGPIPCESQ